MLRRRVRGFSNLPQDVPISGQTSLGIDQNSLWHDTKTFTRTAIAGAPFSYMLHDQGARLRLTTADTKITIGAVATSGNTALGDTVDIRKDGSYFTTAQFPNSTGSSVGARSVVTVALPPGLKTIDLVEQNCFITDIACTGTILTPSRPLRSFNVIGASGSMGYFGWDESNVIPGMLVFDLCWRGRVAWSGRFDECYIVGNNGYGLTSYGVVSPATAAAFAQSTVIPRGTGSLERTHWFEFGAGEQEGNLSTPTVFAANLTSLVDATFALDPGCRIYLQTPVIINSPVEGTPNAGGFTMQNFRDAIAGVNAARPQTRLINGYAGGAPNAMSTLTSDLQDGLHFVPGFPVTHIAGHVKAWNYVQPLLAAA